jgi:hypothetical protein
LTNATSNIVIALTLGVADRVERIEALEDDAGALVDEPDVA